MEKLHTQHIGQKNRFLAEKLRQRALKFLSLNKFSCISTHKLAVSQVWQ